MKNFNGKVLFLDRSDINTDEIIPAKYLTENSKEALKPHLLEDLKIEGFDPKDAEGKQVVISRSNFGCGSSREHAPWAFEVNGINLVVAENFARIFRQNMFNCGMMAVELPGDAIREIFSQFGGADAEASVDGDGNSLVSRGGGKGKAYSYKISEFDKTLVKSGGWVGFADSRY